MPMVVLPPLVGDLLAVLLDKVVAERLVLGECFAEDTVVSGGNVPDSCPDGTEWAGALPASRPIWEFSMFSS